MYYKSGGPPGLNFPPPGIVHVFILNRFVYISNNAESEMVTSYSQHMNT